MRNEISPCIIDEPEEILQDLKKIDMTQCFPNPKLVIGDIVRWKYEWIRDPSHGSLYIVVGFDSEHQNIIIVRVLDDPLKINEFHISQLEVLSINP